ncbi:MAG: hypothetical protein ACR650_00205 [Methylocystis sp.]
MSRVLSDHPFAPGDGSRELASKLRGGAADVRSALLTVLLGAAPIHNDKARMTFSDGSTLRVDGVNWTICERRKVPLCLATRSGRDFLTLAAGIFGGRKGVAAVRILEAATGVKLDAQAARAIADEVDNFFQRKDGR